WQAARPLLEREVEGLENRIRNHRRKILDQHQEKTRLEGIICELQNRSKSGAASEPGTAVVVLPVSPPATPEPEQREGSLKEAEDHLGHRMMALERLAGELADQRLQLLEQWERFFQTQHSWQQD